MGLRVNVFTEAKPCLLGLLQKRENRERVQVSNSERWRRDRERTLLSRRDPSGHS